MSEQYRPDVPNAADLIRLLDWTLTEALSLRHASEVTIREREHMVEILTNQSHRLTRAWKRLSWRFEGSLMAIIGTIIQVALPEYLEESSQVLSATEMAGAFPDTARWRTLYEVLSNGLNKVRELAAQDRRLAREIARRQDHEIWPLVGYVNQAAYEEAFSPSFSTLEKRAQQKQATAEERSLLKTLLDRESVSEAELTANGIARETIIDTVSALAKEKLVKVSEESEFALTGEGRERVNRLLTETGEDPQ